MAEASISPATCGIYGIFGPKGRVYVGQSIDIRKRFRQHRARLLRGDHPSPKLRHAWAKYGEAEFRIEILAEVARDKDLLTLAEQEFMDFYRLGAGLYNAAPAAGSQLGRKLTSEHVAALIKANTGRVKTPAERAKISVANAGKVLSQETRAKLSEAHSGKVLSAEHRVAIRNASAMRKESGLPVGRPKGSPVSDSEREQRRAAFLGKTHAEDTKFKMRRTRYAMQNPGLSDQQLDALAALPSYREFGSRAAWERKRKEITGSYTGASENRRYA